MKLFLYNLLQNYVHGGQKKEKKLLRREQLAHASILGIQKTNAPMVLELACGSGNLAGEFMPEKYIGIDIDTERIESAKKSHPGHKFLSCGIDDEKFKELLKECDFIFCNGLLHHLSDQQCLSLLNNIRQLAPKPATFIVMEPVMPQIWKNPIGFVLANLDNGHNMKSVAGYLNLFKEPPLRMEPLSFWPRWPVSGFAFVLRLK